MVKVDEPSLLLVLGNGGHHHHQHNPLKKLLTCLIGGFCPTNVVAGCEVNEVDEISSCCDDDYQDEEEVSVQAAASATQAASTGSAILHPQKVVVDVEDAQSSKEYLELINLPEELLHRVLTFLDTASDRFSLQLINKLFHRLSNSPKIIRCMQLLPRLASPKQPTGNYKKAAASTTMIIQKDDSLEIVLPRLLRFARVGNLDALLLLGLIAIYMENDTMTGWRLLQRGIQEGGDLRCKYEIANNSLLILILGDDDDDDDDRSKRRNQQQQLMQEAAKTGYAPAIAHFIGLNDDRRLTTTTTSHQEEIVRKARLEMRIISTCMNHLMRSKKLRQHHPTALHHRVIVCANPLCFRQCHDCSTRPPSWERQYTPHWKRYRQDILKCGVNDDDNNFPDDDVKIMYNNNDNPVHHSPFIRCTNCRNVYYCGRTCQVLHWAEHREDCIYHQWLEAYLATLEEDVGAPDQEYAAILGGRLVDGR